MLQVPSNNNNNKKRIVPTYNTREKGKMKPKAVRIVPVESKLYMMACLFHCKNGMQS